MITDSTITRIGQGVELHHDRGRHEAARDLFVQIWEGIGATMTMRLSPTGSDALENRHLVVEPRATPAWAAGELAVEVADDDLGGADAVSGSGLRGLGDRVTALGGRLELESPAGAGTRVRARIPC